MSHTFFPLIRPLTEIPDDQLDAGERRRKRDLPSMTPGVRWYFTYRRSVWLALTVASFLTFCVAYIMGALMAQEVVNSSTMTWSEHAMQPWVSGLATLASCAFLLRYVLNVAAETKYQKTRVPNRH